MGGTSRVMLNRNSVLISAMAFSPGCLTGAKSSRAARRRVYADPSTFDLSRCTGYGSAETRFGAGRAHAAIDSSLAAAAPPAAAGHRAGHAFDRSQRRQT